MQVTRSRKVEKKVFAENIDFEVTVGEEKGGKGVNTSFIEEEGVVEKEGGEEVDQSQDEDTGEQREVIARSRR